MITSGPIDLDQIAVLLQQQHEAIERLAQRMPAMPAPILLLEEAVAYVKCESASAFYAWCTANRVRPCSRGRYARRVLDAALHRESMRSTKKKKISEKPTHEIAA